jgi:hypothetical protein
MALLLHRDELAQLALGNARWGWPLARFGFRFAHECATQHGEGVAGRNGPQRWAAEDGIAGCSGEETSSPGALPSFVGTW